MNDDWRLRVDLHAAGPARVLSERLDAAELEHDLEKSFHDRVIVSINESELLCYAGTREQAEKAEELIRRIAADKGLELVTELRHWHPTAEEWEDPDAPLPDSDAAAAAEREERIEREREESDAQGYPDYEVRVECRHHGETVELANRLREQGLPSVQRWRYLLLGARDEDSANQLAERVRALAPADCTVTAEASGRAVEEGTRGNPFAVFGGLGG